MCTIFLNIKICVIFTFVCRIWQNPDLARNSLPEIFCFLMAPVLTLAGLAGLDSFRFLGKILYFLQDLGNFYWQFWGNIQNYTKYLSNVARSVIANNSTLESWIAFHMFNLSSCLDGSVDTIDQLNVKSDRGRHVTVILVFFSKWRYFRLIKLIGRRQWSIM